MDLLTNILGGQQQQQEFQDFSKRYEKGAPWDGFDDAEAVNRYNQVAPNIPPDVYEQSARESFSRLDPQQRRQLGQYLQQQAPQYGVQFPDVDRDGQDDRLQDPDFLAQATGQMHRQQPGILGQILGGGGGGIAGGLGSMLGGGQGSGGGLGGMLGGGQQSRGGTSGGGLLASPIAKAALGGIAAMAVQHMTKRR